MIRFTMLVVPLLVLAGAPNALGQDTDEVKRLKAQVELLQAKLEVANLTIEKLEVENQKLKAGGEVEGKAKKSLSDRLPAGTSIVGTYKLPGVNGESGTATLTIAERDGNKVKGTYKAEGGPGFEFEGTISGNTMTGKSIGSAVQKSLTVSMRGDALDGTAFNKDRPQLTGRVSFKLDK